MPTFLRKLNVFTLILRRYSSSSITPTKQFPSLQEYLSNSLGFSEQQSQLTSTKLAHFWRSRGEQKVSDFNFADNAISVVNFLKLHGFDDTHIRKIVSSHPRILSSKVDETLKPKIELLQNLGFSGCDIVDIISTNCKLFWSSLDSCMLPTILSLRKVMSCDDEVILVIKKTHWRHVSGGAKYLGANVELLENSGVPIKSIRKSLILKPGLFLRTNESFKDLVTKVEVELGIPPDSGVFLSGLHLLNSLTVTTFKLKCEVYKSFGWSDSDIKTIIRRHPCCLMFSEQRLKKSLSFLMKELGYDPGYLTARPALLSCSVEKRLFPRYRILSVLKEKGLISVDFSFHRAVQLTEPLFLKKFVIPFNEVHKMYTELTGCDLILPTDDTNVEGNLYR